MSGLCWSVFGFGKAYSGAWLDLLYGTRETFIPSFAGWVLHSHGKQIHALLESGGKRWQRLVAPSILYFSGYSYTRIRGVWRRLLCKG